MGHWSESFQSEKVREITANMTPRETAALQSIGAMSGIWVAATLAVPLSFGLLFVYQHQWKPGYYIIAALVVVHFIGMSMIRRKIREILCSTEYAKSKGYRPDDLKMFKFPWS